MPFPRDSNCELAGAYDPKAVEMGWAQWWDEEAFFHEEPDDKCSKDKFVMMIPPPNVTGSLHLGHTLTVAIEDTITRYNRMLGKKVLWLPGVDHAGIATQSVVERRLLADEGKSRHDYGRTKFLEKVWDWKNVHGNHINNQLRRLGVSVDWEREAFTMDARLSKGVEEAFVRMFDSGYIYRDTRLVSWCPYLKTALSDIEVDPMEVSKPDRIRIPGYEKTIEVGMLWHFKYPVKGQTDRHIEVATTRLETMLGDVAVAVHPEDARYKDLVGCELEHPFLPERKIVVVSDTYVSQEFGTGAVKITPAHDKNDYDLGRRHKLPMINVFTLDGMMNTDAGEFAGQHRFECRVKLEKRLEELGLMGEKVPNTKAMQIPRCSRSNDVIEYMLMPQWYVDCKSAAARATAAVRQGDLRIVPEMYEKTWFQWLDNIKDWCISRQLWWGHQIPAYRVVEPAQETEVWVAAKSMEAAEAKARAKLNCDVKMQRDEDVLDTWFSSGLFPFSTLGWPEDTPDFRSFFPNTMLETGHDILFFWVARMVMMSFILLDCLPFHTVYLHAMVRDAHGKKMSKSLGNVIDPIEVIEGITLPSMQANLQNNANLSEKEIKRASDAQKKDFPKGIPECGADALRYGMLAYTKQGRNINLDVQRVIGYR
ncbi:MAG: uncharacterized protein KVP18_003862, partial [Porospora cf. gigantea A]|uniref:uncharacterized protein n=2 Tax=Porospora cf. gigantea A TaxID=2853593 RepID=UPI00355A9E2C